jgi:hypothetical protein
VGGGSCEQSNEPSGSVKSGEFLHCLSYYQLLSNSVERVSVTGVGKAIINCQHVRMWKLLVVAYFKVGLIIIVAARIYFKRGTQPTFNGGTARHFSYKPTLKPLKIMFPDRPRIFRTEELWFLYFQSLVMSGTCPSFFNFDFLNQGDR